MCIGGPLARVESEERQSLITLAKLCDHDGVQCRALASNCERCVLTTDCRIRRKSAEAGHHRHLRRRGLGLLLPHPLPKAPGKTILRSSCCRCGLLLFLLLEGGEPRLAASLLRLLCLLLAKFQKDFLQVTEVLAVLRFQLFFRPLCVPTGRWPCPAAEFRTSSLQEARFRDVYPRHRFVVGDVARGQPDC